ncbi:MAG: nucleotidyltransferase domain-containing protein [candidate division NC10 bacterium]|nr:nucleotidyltransferase domain-containing protein [candidate division NC10 bacterium]
MADYPKVGAIEQFLERVILKEDPICVLLFGSLARGDYLLCSDADILAIFREPEVNFLQGIGRLKELDDSGWIEPIGYGKEQFKRMIREVNPLAWEALTDGILLYLGDEAAWQEILRVSAETKQTLDVVRTPTGWEIRNEETWQGRRSWSSPPG